jgi:hypothetical protein
VPIQYRSSSGADSATLPPPDSERDDRARNAKCLIGSSLCKISIRNGVLIAYQQTQEANGPAARDASRHAR